MRKIKLELTEKVMKKLKLFGVTYTTLQLLKITIGRYVFTIDKKLKG